jgi:hypothetical protein
MFMTVFADTDQFYTITRALFARIAENDPGAADAILASRLVIRVRCTDPDAEFTLDGRQRPLQTIFGPAKQRPTLDIELNAGTLHRIMLGELSLKTALANGKLAVRGPVWKAMALADLFRHSQVLYPQVLKEHDWPRLREL